MKIQLMVEFGSLFCAGMLAGIEFMIHYGLRTAAEGLDERPQIELRQALILRLRWLVPAFFLPTAVLGIGLITLEGSGTGLAWRWAALAALLLWICVRVIGTVGINAATLTWRAGAPPDNWREQIQKAERFHIVGTWAAVLAFVFFLMALQRNG